MSTRTMDVVKSVKVLSAQFLCLLKIHDLDQKIKSIENRLIFSNPEKLMDIKKAFVRYGVEETLRRTINKEAKNIV